MTRTEKTVLLLLCFFLIVGVGVRVARRYYLQTPLTVDYSAHPSLPPKAAENLQPQTVKVDLNTGTQEQLEKLTGIGPKLARAIIKYRTEHNGFKTPEEVLQVPGFGKSRLEKLRENLAVNGKIADLPSEMTASQSNSSYGNSPAKSHSASSSSISNKVNMNKAAAEQFAALPVIGKKLAREIVSYRSQNGPFREKNELLKVKGVSVTTYNKVEQYLTLK